MGLFDSGRKLTDEEFYKMMEELPSMSSMMTQPTQPPLDYNPNEQINALNNIDFPQQVQPTQQMNQPVDNSGLMSLMERGEGVVADGIKGLIGPLASDWRSNLQKDTNVEPYTPGKDVLKQSYNNFDDSLQNSLGGIADIVSKPTQAIQSMYDLSSGALQHALPDDMSWNEEDKTMASTAGKQIKEDWTTSEGFQKMVAERPSEVFPLMYGAGILGNMAGKKAIDTLPPANEWGGAIENVTDKALELSTGGIMPNVGRKEMVTPGINAKTKIDELGFYSEAENVVNKLKQETNHPDHIRQFMMKNGVTAEEMGDVGILNYLKTAKDNNERVTKTGLLTQIGDNKTHLEETQHEGIGEGDYDERLQQLALDDPADGRSESDVASANFEIMDNENIDYEVEEFMDEYVRKADVDYEDANALYQKMYAINTEKYPVEAGQSTTLGEMRPEQYPVWWTQISEAIDGDNFDSLPSATQSDVESAVYMFKEDQYLQDPYYEWNVGIDGEDFTVTGNEELGMMITGPDGQRLNEEPVYSINEANIQIQDSLGEYNMGGSGDGSTKYMDYTQDGIDGDSYREIPISSNVKDGQESYRGGHFEEDNVVAHLRTSDRLDNQGNNVLFIEEVQSDWHQGGRKSGYNTKETKLEQQALAEKIKLHDDEYIVYEKKAKEVGLNFREGWDDASIFKNDELIGSIKTRDDNPVVRWTELAMSLPVNDFKVFDTLMGEVKEYVNRGTALRTESNKLQGGVPDAPLKDAKWQEMAFKRAMKIAADGDYDKVAWTNSQQQVNLYSERYRELYENMYDKKLPGYAKKFAKQNGSQTGMMDMSFVDGDQGNFRSADDMQSVNYIDITPELKTNVKKGQSMYGSTSVAKPEKVKGGLLAQEPLVVYRSSTSGSYDKFDKSKQRTSTLGKGVYMFEGETGANDWVGSNLQKIELPHDYMDKSINWADGGQSDFVTKAFNNIDAEVDFKLDLEDGGIDVYPELVKKLGEDKAQALLSKHGIYGNRRDGELTTFNVDDAKIISTEAKKAKKGLLD